VNNRATHRSASRRAVAATASAVLAAAFSLVLAQGPGAAPADAALQVQGPLVTKPMSYLGVFEQNEIKSYSQVSQFGQAVGRAPNLVLYFLGWGLFNLQFADAAWAHHAVLLTDVDPRGVSVASIAAGEQDTHLRTVATEVKSFGHPVIIAFGHEMNGAFYPWGYRHVPAQTFVQAFRHIVTLFRAAGATNVTWLWTVNAENRKEGPIRNWWPGSAYVNWVAIDAYYYAKTYWFSNIFLPTMAMVRRFTDDPILVGETAAGQEAGQAAKISDVFAGASRKHVLGVVWFDEAQKGSHWHQDWRIEGDPASVAAFKTAVKQYVK
jgi:mannan endo-1,4-beta-mannosidase